MKIIYKVFNLQSYMEEFAIRIESMDVETARDMILAFFELEPLLKMLNGYVEPIVAGSLAHLITDLERGFETDIFDSEVKTTIFRRMMASQIKILKDVRYMNKKDVRYLKSENVPINNVVELIETCISKLDGHSTFSHWEDNHFIVHDPLGLDNLHLLRGGAHIFEDDLKLRILERNNTIKAERH